MPRASALALVLLVQACGAPRQPVASAPPAPRATRARSFAVEYREAANAFTIVDEVSVWYPEKNFTEYREAFEARFGITKEESARLAAWAEVRKRAYTEEPTDDAILLGRRKPEDRLAAAFQRARDLDAALARAAEVVGESGAATLRAAFDALRPKLDVLLAESRAFGPREAELQTRLDDPKVGAFASRIARFYRATELPTLTVLFVWWPPIDATTASLAGDVLLLRVNPEKHGADAARDVDVPLHELVHVASSRQPEAQKLALSAAFSAKCGTRPKIRPASLLEEPLAVAHQKMFVSETEPKRLDRARSWYGDPWSSALAKLVFDAVVHAHAEGRVLDQALIEDAGRACRELAGVGKQLTR